MLTPIDTAPRVHGRKPSHKTQRTKVEYRSVADICEGAKMVVSKGTRDNLICILWEIIRKQRITFGSKKM